MKPFELADSMVPVFSFMRLLRFVLYKMLVLIRIVTLNMNWQAYW